MARDIGSPQTDAQFDFSRSRRQRVVGRLADRLRGQPADFDVILPFEEVLQALGRRGEHSLGLQTIEIDSIVGTVDRGREVGLSRDAGAAGVHDARRGGAGLVQRGIRAGAGNAGGGGDRHEGGGDRRLRGGVTLRYMLLNTHEWDEEILERVREEIKSPSWEDTQIRDLRRELS